MSATELSISADISMGELLQRIPGAQRALFRRYHIGGCSSCGFRNEERLDELCKRNDHLPVDEVIEYLKESHEADLQIQITAKEVHALMTAPEPRLRILDVRTREEWEAVHIDGSTHFTQELMSEILSQWPREEGLIAILDHDGKRSLDAAAYFAGHGFKNIKAIRGGIDAWSLEVDTSLPRYHLE